MYSSTQVSGYNHRGVVKTACPAMGQYMHDASWGSTDASPRGTLSWLAAPIHAPGSGNPCAGPGAKSSQKSSHSPGVSMQPAQPAADTGHICFTPGDLMGCQHPPDAAAASHCLPNTRLSMHFCHITSRLLELGLKWTIIPTYLPDPYAPTLHSYKPYSLPDIPALPLQATLLHTYHTYATSTLLCGRVLPEIEYYALRHLFAKWLHLNLINCF